VIQHFPKVRFAKTRLEFLIRVIRKSWVQITFKNEGLGLLVLGRLLKTISAILKGVLKEEANEVWFL